MNNENTLRSSESSWMMVWNGSEYEVIEGFNTGSKTTEDVDKAKSFGGDRSAAARYAARMRWGNRQGLTSDATGGNMGSEGGGMDSKYGLKTELEVIVNPTTNMVLVRQENGGVRAPTAGERGLPTSAEFKKTVTEELAVLGKDPTLPQNLSPALKALTQFTVEFDRVQGSDNDFLRNKVVIVRMRAERMEWSGGLSNPLAVHGDRAKAEARSAISKKLLELNKMMLALLEPLRPQ